jgi:broad specificity phosphatase PhoE
MRVRAHHTSAATGCSLGGLVSRLMRERRYTFVRHASTVYNDLHLLNGDPRVPVLLDGEGQVAAAALGRRLEHCPFDLALHTRFARTRETLMLMLGGRRDVPVALEAAFDDIDVGIFEGQDVQVYRDWRARHSHAEAVPGGESRLGALGRYADGCARLLARHDARCVLAVVHDIPIRFLHNAVLAADPIDGPVRTVANLERLSVGESQLAAGLAVMRRRLSGLPPV